MHLISSNFAPRLKGIFELLSDEGIFAEQIIAVGPKVNNKPVLNINSLAHWRDYNLPTNEGLRALIQALDTFASDERFPILKEELDGLIKSFTSGGKREDLFRPAHSFVDLCASDTPVAALWIALMQAPEIHITNKALQEKITQKDPSFTAAAMTPLLKATKVPTPAQMCIFLEACNDEIAKEPGATLISKDQIERMTALTQEQWKAQEELGKSQMAHKMATGDRERKIGRWLEKYHVHVKTNQRGGMAR